MGVYLVGAYEKMEPESCGRTGSNHHRLENKKFRPVKRERKKKKKTTEQVVQRNCGAPILEDIQALRGQGPEQPALTGPASSGRLQ